MITVERKRNLDLPAERVRAVLSDVEQMQRLMPRAERVEVLSQNENRARLAVTLRFGRFGTQRVEGEARLLDDGVRFVAVQPMEIDARWTIVSYEAGTEAVVRVMTAMPRVLGAFARLIPHRVLEERIGVELEAALDALEAAGKEQTPDKEQALGKQ
ncbi:MAG TPA: SRPBCC family protein [Herpetosiphonaceae bacterium]